MTSEVSSTNEPTEYLFHDESGDAQFFVYHLYPGIAFVCYSAHMDDCMVEFPTDEPVLEIGYCMEGRLEQQTDCGFCYLVPGDISVSVCEKNMRNYHFPLHHYHGISFVIQPESAQREMAPLLGNFGINLIEVSKRLGADRRFSIIKKTNP